MRVGFGEFALDPEAHELTRSGRRVPLTPKAFQLLELLVERRPRAVSKAQIHDSLWPGTHVTEASLARVANEVRKALGDDAREPRYLRTVYGFGYAFVAQATEQDKAPPARGPLFSCRLIWGKREIPLVEGENVLGRVEDAAVWIDSTKISRRHARILVSGGKATLEDLGSKNGTYLRGKKLSAPAVLSDGDEISVGAVVLVFRSARAAGSTKTDGGG
jgi:DNA-binding winged helix-turn-helix (wHTH) protein